MTTFNNNFILRASLELADGKTSGWWFGVCGFSHKDRKGHKEWGMGNGVDFNTEALRHGVTEARQLLRAFVPLCLISRLAAEVRGEWRVVRSQR